MPDETLMAWLQLSLAAMQQQGRQRMMSIQQAQAPQTVTAYHQAVGDLGLTPQEQFLYQHHLDNLVNGGRVVQPNGDVSTLLQEVVRGPDGRFYNIPTVWGGKVLEAPQAAQQAATVGWDKWPAYNTPSAADDRYEKMHEYLGRDVAEWTKANPNYRSQGAPK